MNLEDIKLTKKEVAVLKLANRHCGLAYRSPKLPIAKNLQERGILFVRDRGEHMRVSRFVFKPTLIGGYILAEQIIDKCP